MGARQGSRAVANGDGVEGGGVRRGSFARNDEAVAIELGGTVTNAVCGWHS